MGERDDGRIAYIDSLKGMAIFLVVLGHIVTYDKDFHGLYNFIYSFHMPLFMFLSGCTASISYGRWAGTDGGYLSKRFMNIMIPYFAWAVVLPVFVTRPLNKEVWHAVFRKTFVTNRMFWFLPTLYGLIVAYVCYSRIKKEIRSRLERYDECRWIAFVLEAISCIVVVSVLTGLMVLTGYQLFRDIVGFTIPFFAAVLYMENEQVQWIYYRRLTVEIALTVYILLIGKFDFDHIAVQTSLLRMLLGMCAVIVLLQVPMKLKIPKIIGSQLTIWGRHSLLIYILHTQMLTKDGLLSLHFSNRIGTLVWYCFVSSLVCYLSSLVAIMLGNIPVMSIVLLGKKKNVMLFQNKSRHLYL